MNDIMISMKLFGYEVKVFFLTAKNNVLAYAWHYSEEKAIKHLDKICEFHGIKGEIIESEELEKWLQKELENVVIGGRKFKLPSFNYKDREVYEAVIQIPKGKTATYSDIAKLAGVKYRDVLLALMRNPFQILIPCHRLLTKNATLMGFYPLGKEVKKKILRIEGADFIEK